MPLAADRQNKDAVKVEPGNRRETGDHHCWKYRRKDASREVFGKHYPDGKAGTQAQCPLGEPSHAGHRADLAKVEVGVVTPGSTGEDVLAGYGGFLPGV